MMIAKCKRAVPLVLDVHVCNSGVGLPLGPFRLFFCPSLSLSVILSKGMVTIVRF